jgi:apolipoprotein N-acyltransferase
MLTRTAKVIAPCVIAGAVLPLAFAPFHAWWLAPCSYAVLFLCWRNASPKLSFWSGFGFGFAAFLFGIYWIYISVHEIGGAPIWLGVLLMLGLVAVMALYPALVGWIGARWLGTTGALRWLMVLPALLVLSEWIRGWFLTGFGWLSPGYAQTESWLLGLAPILGVLGVSWAVFVIGGALATAVAGTNRERLNAAAVVIVLVAASWIATRQAWTEPKDGTITVALTQGAVPQTIRWLPEQLPVARELYLGLTLEALGSDLIVWPEAAIPNYYENEREYLGEIERLAAGAGSRVMFGMLKYDWQTGAAHNALFTLGLPERSAYIKRHLVPYGEYFPVPGFVRDWLRAMELPNIDTQPGPPGQPPIALLGERIAVTICYEDVFGAEQLDSFPEATLLVNVSNDAWFGDSLAAHQHLQIARMRAAEVRRYQLRSTNTGITAVIDPYGQVVSRLPQFEPGVLRESVRGMTGSTPYIAWGNFAAVLLALGALGAGVLLNRLRPKI